MNLDLNYIIVKQNGGKMYVESKGRFTATDRKKMKLVKEANPELDIRLLFQTPDNKITKGSKTTYVDWAVKHGYPWAAKEIPQEWLEE